jgi:hypothetical protein
VIQQYQEFIGFFAFRSSDFVGSNIAGYTTVAGAIPGNVIMKYGVESPEVLYDVDIRNKLVCVRSELYKEKIVTTDCFSTVYALDYSEPRTSDFFIKIEKTPTSITITNETE